MKLFRTLLFAVAIIISGALLTVPTGCKSTPRAAVVYNTFKSSWTVSQAAYGVWCERVVQGKTTPEAEARADAAWNKYRAAFKVSFALSTSNWSAPTPATLDLAEKELLSLLTLLSK